MDPDSLRNEVDEWVRDGVITESQAEEILSRYDDEDPRWSRIVLALSLVGAALVLAGALLFLATNWEDLPRAARTAVLVAGPAIAYAGGAAAYDNDAARIGHALCVLGAVLVGPSAFLFEDLFGLGVGSEWLLFVWAAVAVPTGHALDSRAGTGLGVAVLVALTVDLVGSGEPTPVVGALGIVLFAFGSAHGDLTAVGPRGDGLTAWGTSDRPVRRTAWTYRVGGAALTLGALVVLTRLEGRFARFDPEPTVPLLAVGGGALAGIAWLAAADERVAAGWSTAAFGALLAAVGIAALTPGTVPAFPAFVLLHFAALGAVFATGYLGYRARTRAFVDLATLAALAQTLSFVASTVVDALSGSVALVVAGVVLLGAGVALERGRRSLLARL